MRGPKKAKALEAVTSKAFSTLCHVNNTLIQESVWQDKLSK